MTAEVGTRDAGGQPESDFSQFRFFGCRMPERRFERRAIFAPEVELVPKRERVDHAEQNALSRGLGIQGSEHSVLRDTLVGQRRVGIQEGKKACAFHTRQPLRFP